MCISYSSLSHHLVTEGKYGLNHIPSKRTKQASRTCKGLMRASWALCKRVACYIL